VVGNDIVDLQYFEAPHHHNLRYLDRVCTFAEATAIRQSQNPSKDFCLVWAAKEAAFKIFSKHRKDLHFAPRQFVTDFAVRMDEPHSTLQVYFADVFARVAISSTDHWVHAVATIPGWRAIRWSVQEMVGEVSVVAKSHAESLAVRALALEVLAKSGEQDLRLKFTGRIPSLTFADGERAPFDISLSHHGRFVSAALGGIAGSSCLRQPERKRSAKTDSPREPCFTCMA
jgi:phosphopantetheine--protein transferase-like protein